MIEHIVIIFGILGTGLLALDLAQPRLLRIINVYFKQIIRLRFSPDIIWKPNDELTHADKRVFEAIKILSAYTFFLILLFTYPFLNWNYEISDYVKYGLLVLLSLPVLSLALVQTANNVSIFLLRIINFIVEPVLVIYFYTFSIVGVIVQYIVRRVFKLEDAYLAKLQAPRFIGLFMLFLSFLFQLF